MTLRDFYAGAAVNICEPLRAQQLGGLNRLTRVTRTIQVGG